MKILQFVIALLAVDFAAATFHWFEDNYLYYDFPFPFLDEISKANEMHHFMPRVITYYSFTESVYVPIIISAFSLIVIHLITSFKMNKYPIFYATAFVLGSIGNVIHKCQHQRECERPWFITMLYKYKILISREKHMAHHAGESNTEFYQRSNNYGLIFEMPNNIYDALDIWSTLEKLIAMFGITKCNQRNEYPYRDTFDMDCPPPLKAEDVDDYIKRLKQIYDVEVYRKCQSACSYM
jgi:hypothetical protein